MLQFKDQDGDYSSSPLGRVVKLTSVQRASLAVELMLGRNAATSFSNSGSGVDAQGIGSGPTYGDHRITVGDVDGQTPGRGLDTNFRHIISDGFTYLTIAAMPIDNQFNQLTILGDTISDTQLYCYASSGQLVTQIGLTSGSPIYDSVACVLSAPESAFRGLSGRISGQNAPTIKADEFKNGVRTNTATKDITGRSFNGQNPNFTLRQGSATSAPSNTLGGAFRIAATLIWRRSLTDAELLQAYLEARSQLAGFGIAC